MIDPDLKFVTDYWHEEGLKSSFKQFVYDIFRLDFTKWDELGYWDDQYQPFSFVRGNNIIANVCLYTLPCILHGKERKVSQISAVATHPDYRMTGLAKMLLQEAIKHRNESSDFIFLYANPDAQGFYDKTAFTPMGSQVAIMDLEGAGTKNFQGIRQLDPGDHELLLKRVSQREPVSNIFSSQSEKLTMFHLLYSYSDKLYYIRALDMMLVMERTGDMIVIYDVIAPEILPFSEWRSYLDLEGIRQVLFKFNPDKLVGVTWHKSVIQNGLNMLNPLTEHNDLVFPAFIQA